MTIPDMEAWDAWTPDTLSRRLSGVSLPWCIVGGWALDLWHGSQTRAHSDLEFTVLRRDLNAFLCLFHELTFYTAHSGVLEPVRAEQKPSSDILQFWGFDRVAERWRIDMMIEPGTDETWAYKRAPSIIRPRADMVMQTINGIPYLNPAAVLLFKARDRRPKDRGDFEKALPTLQAHDRAWLKACLGSLHPGHEWSTAL